MKHIRPFEIFLAEKSSPKEDLICHQCGKVIDLDEEENKGTSSLPLCNECNESVFFDQYYNY